MLKLIEDGIVYRNPKPHLRAVHAWHPSIVRLADGRLLCAFDLGEAVESLDYRTFLAESHDDGRTWSAPRRLIHDDAPRTTHTMRLARTRNGELVGFGARFHRDDPEEGLTNRANMGFVRMDLVLSRSGDGGVTWSPPVNVQPPLAGPAFEPCHAIVELRDGRWLAPTQTWRGWDGEEPNGMKAIALVSDDRGATWPRYIDILDGRADRVIHFEQSVVQVADGRLLATAWAFHEPTQQTRPTPYTICADGEHFGAPRPTGLHAQTAKLLALADGRVLCVYRGDAEPGLWAELVEIRGDEWVNLSRVPVLCGFDPTGAASASASDQLATLRVGFPQMLQLPDGDVLVVFWCCRDTVYEIRWSRLRAAREHGV